MTRRFHIDRSPIALTNLVTRQGGCGSLELYGLVEAAHLKESRTQTIQKLAPRPDYVGLHVADFDPSGPVGQLCALTMRAVGEYGRADNVAAKPGSRERDLGRLYQRVSTSGRNFLFGYPSSKRLTHVLHELTETAGGKLGHVAVTVRSTPRRGERFPTWTLFLGIEEAAP